MRTARTGTTRPRPPTRRASQHAPDAGPRLLWALLLTLGFAGVEAVTGFWAGSLALLGDAGHMVTDSASLALAAFAAWLSQRPPTQRHTYGYGRVETLAALLNVLFMVLVVVGISVAAVERILDPVGPGRSRDPGGCARPGSSTSPLPGC
jgi:cobalt-zinc-cadmium efflux system protein